jgi:UDP-N-acetylglucosamine 3-dehydrogenase
MPSHSKSGYSAAGDIPAKIRLGIIGCGAIAEGAHLPAALALPNVELTVLSDTSAARLRQVQTDFGLDSIGFTDYRQTFGRVDAVVLALPNTLHAPVACEFLSRGIHVLCEKPLAPSAQECEAMCRAAAESRAVLAVGYVTRFHPSTELTRELVRSGFLGALQSFEYEFGTAGGWATQSGYNLSRSSAGGGVLVVSGSHFIDRMLYFFESVNTVDCTDDNYGGVEANCIIHFRAELQGHSVSGVVTLSKTHRLANRLRISGEKGVLEVREGQSQSVTFYPAGVDHRHEIFMGGSIASPEPDYFQFQLIDFLQAIRTGAQPKVNGKQGSQSVILMERCYQLATRMEELWHTATVDRLRLAMPPASMHSSTSPAEEPGR